MMSNTASQCAPIPSRSKTLSPWSVEPLVRISLRPARCLRGYFEPGADELTDPCVDLMPQIDVMRIERVVEVEHPGIDVGESAGGFSHLDRSFKPSSRRTPGPIRRVVVVSTVRVAFDCCWHS